MGFDDADVENATVKVTKADVEFLWKGIVETIKKILVAGSGIHIIKDDICNFSIQGGMTEEKIINNSKLNVSPERSHTKVEPYLKISMLNAAPDCKKHIGCMKGNKFVEDKSNGKKGGKKEAVLRKSESAKKASAKAAPAKKAPAKKGGKKK